MFQQFNFALKLHRISIKRERQKQRLAIIIRLCNTVKAEAARSAVIGQIIRHERYRACHAFIHEASHRERLIRTNWIPLLPLSAPVPSPFGHSFSDKRLHRFQGFDKGYGNVVPTSARPKPSFSSRNFRQKLFEFKNITVLRRKYSFCISAYFVFISLKFYRITKEIETNNFRAETKL